MTYFAAPLGDIDLCVITVGPVADDLSMSCTPVHGVATYGLRAENLEYGEQAWLIGSEGQSAHLTATEGWDQEAVNFFVRNS